jgi:hypothetical protein
VTPADEDRLTDYSQDGVDLTLIRCMLALTPAEQLEVLDEYVENILSIQCRKRVGCFKCFASFMTRAWSL